MIEWIPIKEFLETGEDEDEEFLFYDKKETRVVTTSIDTIRREGLIKSFTHAAYINLPVEKTLAEKLEEYHLSKVGWSSQDRDVYKGLALISKQHYEGEK